eukprot:TRINITY_DN7815_c0_g1_i2.p1 TRINITY_DN7815_c0_g1~~TRINITY_DN7815_c0_g1_i2.p1  ORF type:complete len:458 (+),score=159.63 TRINITY_DN7815_c0_g1_i2:58-1374(+)
MDFSMEIMRVSAIAVGKVVVLSGVGVLMGWHPGEQPLLDQVARGRLSRMLVTVFVPALAVYLLLSSVDLEQMRTAWPLLLWGAVGVFLAGIISYPVVYFILGKQAVEARGFFIAGSFGNTIGLPFLMVSSVCEDPFFKDEYGGSCQTLGFGMIVLCSLAWRLALFGMAVPWLKHGAATAARQNAQREQEQATQGGSDAAPTPGAVVEVATEMQPRDAVAAPPAATAPPPQVLPEVGLCDVLQSVARDPNVMLPFLAIFVALIPGSKKFLMGTDDGTPTIPLFGTCVKTLGEPVVCIVTLSMAASLLPKGVDMKKYMTPQVFKEISALVVIRFVLHPALGFAIVTYCAKTLGMPGSRLQWLIVYLQFCAPPAQMIIVNLVNLGEHKLTERLGPVFASTYLISIVTVTFWTSVALSLLDDPPDLADNATASNLFVNATVT